jgi:thioester reductase-like protein
VLDPSITPSTLPLADIFTPSAIFLTGASGSLGIFVLEQLIRQTKADIYCLVRASDGNDALARLKRVAEGFDVGWDRDFDARVKPVAGDLGKPLFGLSQSGFDALARTIDAIYHVGALVNFVYPYSVLKGPNVSGTAEILRLACREKVKVVPR